MLVSRKLARHAPEFLRALLANRFERVDAGAIYFPEQRATAAGHYIVTDRKTGRVIEAVPNLLPTEGLAHILNVFGNHAAIPTLYIALHANTTTPTLAHNAAGYTATFAEITSGSEGYTQATRVAHVSVDNAGVAILNNYASPAVFTIITATTLAVNGVAMLTASAKGATTGKLVSAAKFSATRNFSTTDEFDVKYQLALT